MIYKFQFIDLFPYILLIFLCLLFCYTTFKKRDCSFLIFITVFIFAAFRYQTGYDYGNYLETIIQQGEEDKFEVLVRWLIRLSRVTHYQLFFIVTSFLTLYPIYKISKKYSEDPSLSLIFYVLFPVFFLESLSIIRNAVAFSLVALAVDNYLNRSYCKAIIIFLFSLGFHISAIVGVLLVFLDKIRPSRRLIIIIYISSFFVSPLILHIMTSIESDVGILLKVSNYALNGKVGAGATMAILINLIGILCLIYWRRIENLKQYNYLWLMYSLVGVAFWNCFSFEGTLRLRISSYLLLFLILVVPSFKFVSKKIRSNMMKGLISFVLMAVFVASFYINITGHLKDLSKMSFLPYQTVFNRVDYIQYN